MCQSCSTPARASTAIRPTAKPRTTSVARITRRRSKRSLTTPPSSRHAIVGSVIAIPTIASALGRVRERIDLPRHRHEEDPVAEQRDAHPRPQQAEVAVPQRSEQADPAEAAGAVEPLVAMVHRRAGPRRVDLLERARLQADRLAQEVECLVGLHRAREVEALAELAAEVAQRGPLLVQLDALGHDLERAASGRARRPRSQGPSCSGVCPERRNERSIFSTSTGKRLR